MVAGEEGVLDAGLGVSSGELDAAWREAMGLSGVEADDDPEYLSVRQLMERWGLGFQATSRRVKIAETNGLVISKVVMRAGEDGRKLEMKVYKAGRKENV